MTKIDIKFRSKFYHFRRKYCLALEYYERNPPPEKIPKPTTSSPPAQPAQSTNNPNPPQSHDQPKKSEVSLVYELALKRNLPVHFEKISEEGPPHLKHYSIKLHVGKTPEEAERDGEGGKDPKQYVQLFIIQNYRGVSLSFRSKKL